MKLICMHVSVDRPNYLVGNIICFLFSLCSYPSMALSAWHKSPFSGPVLSGSASYNSRRLFGSFLKVPIGIVRSELTLWPRIIKWDLCNELNNLGYQVIC